MWNLLQIKKLLIIIRWWRDYYIRIQYCYLNHFNLVDAFVALGGNPDRTGVV